MRRCSGLLGQLSRDTLTRRLGPFRGFASCLGRPTRGANLDDDSRQDAVRTAG
jgi:hypothetical protein